GPGFFAATVVCAGFAGAAADFGFAGSAAGALRGGPLLSSLFSSHRVLREPPELPADATCTDERGPGAGFDSAEARLIVLTIDSDPRGSAGGTKCGGVSALTA